MEESRDESGCVDVVNPCIRLYLLGGLVNLFCNFSGPWRGYSEEPYVNIDHGLGSR